MNSQPNLTYEKIHGANTFPFARLPWQRETLLFDLKGVNFSQIAPADHRA